MKLAVFGDHRVGVVEGDLIYDVTDAVPGAGPAWPPMYMNSLIANWGTLGPRLAEKRRTAKSAPLASVALLPPNPCPVHVIAAPANYRKHIGEIGARSVSKGRSADQMGFFMKATASLVGAGGAIELPKGSTRRFDHESELAVIIGRRARNVPRAEAMDYVFGYSCLIDVTMRIEPGVAEEERVTRKSFETFTPLGPWIVTADEVPDPHALRNRLWVNGEPKQDANTRDMIVNIAALIELISSVMTLNPGDVIASGTPEGVGPIVAGDEIRIGIESVGEMTLPVVEATQFSPRRF
jgi:2-keto-4-pentenoate hydratase/2-oxohepta-3-ene-1,7-dioic acid hydratase in catechol pathway